MATSSESTFCLLPTLVFPQTPAAFSCSKWTSYNTTSTFSDYRGGITSYETLYRFIEFESSISTVTHTSNGTKKLEENTMFLTKPGSGNGCHPRATPSASGNLCNFEYTAAPCPTGWKGLLTAIQQGITTEYCCPDEPQMKSLAFLSGQTAWPTKGSTSDPQTTQYCYGNSISTFPTDVPTDFIQTEAIYLAPPLTVYYNSDDLAAIPTSTADSLHGQISATLNIVQKVALGVGIPIGLLVLLGAGLIFWRRRRRPTTKVEVLETSEPDWDKPELHGYGLRKKPIVAEVEGYQIHELDGTESPVELGGNDGTPGVQSQNLRIEISAPSSNSAHENVENGGTKGRTARLEAIREGKRRVNDG